MVGTIRGYFEKRSPFFTKVRSPSLSCICNVVKLCLLGQVDDELFFVEFFCGRAEIANAFGRAGMASRAFDVLRSAHHDLTLPIGVVLGMITVLTLPIGCPLHLGTVCTSFCWVNSGTHQRSAAFPLGRVDHQYVIDGNQFAVVSATYLKNVSCPGRPVAGDVMKNSSTHPTPCKKRLCGTPYHSFGSAAAAVGKMWLLDFRLPPRVCVKEIVDVFLPRKRNVLRSHQLESNIHIIRDDRTVSEQNIRSLLLIYGLWTGAN